MVGWGQWSVMRSDKMTCGRGEGFIFLHAWVRSSRYRDMKGTAAGTQESLHRNVRTSTDEGHRIEGVAHRCMTHVSADVVLGMDHGGDGDSGDKN